MTFDIAQGPQALTEGFDPCRLRRGAQETDAVHLSRWLRLGRERHGPQNKDNRTDGEMHYPPRRRDAGTLMAQGWHALYPPACAANAGSERRRRADASQSGSCLGFVDTPPRSC